MIENNRLLAQLDALRGESSSLDPDAVARVKIGQLVETYVESYLNGIDSGAAYSGFSASLDETNTGKSAIHGALDEPFTEDGLGLNTSLDILKREIDAPGIATTSPRFFGYIPGGGLYYSAIADMLAAVSNKYAGVYFASPGAVRVEEQCLAWLADLAGYPAGYGGYLSSGGSMANFTAVVTARDHRGIEGTKIAQSVVYLTDHAHHCIDKAIHLAGLSKCLVRRIPVDERYRMRADLLAIQLKADTDAGLNPFFVVATAGTTNTGSVDPLEEIGNLAAKFGAWYHIDGAYGALFALCEAGRKMLKGMELSDSIVMDPHKTLFLPYGIGALLVKDKTLLLEAHAAGAHYMQDVVHVEATSPATLSPELTKHFRGLRMWLPLQVVGVIPFRSALAEKMLLAQYFHSQLSLMKGFEVGPEPDLSVVTYRYIPQHEDPDLFNQRLVQAIHDDGRIFVSSTQLNGVFMLRLAVVCFRSHKTDIDTALSVLGEIANSLDSQAFTNE
jgi:aromatic-L-amino-acid/L-tryptophan decarboxylase